jgi:hypothetical protein
VGEHLTEGDTINRASMDAKPNDPASELIHDNQYPVSPQHSRFAAKQIRAPETVLYVAEEGQPGWTAGVRLRVMGGQDPPDDVFIDGDAECQSNLLSDSRAAPEEIALFGSNNRINEFFGRTLRTGLAPAFRQEDQAILAFSQNVVKVQQG